VIGRRQAEILQSFGADVAGYDPAPVAMELPRKTPHELMATSRVLFLHCNHRPGRTPVVNRELLGAARSDLILVNTARGGVLDANAAWEALGAGRLGGLALDVFPDEPWPRMADFAAHDRVVVTPHAAGYFDGLGAAVAAELAAVLTAWRADAPLPAQLI
jgi:D-3-phosphoglycerate dehydrogenase